MKAWTDADVAGSRMETMINPLVGKTISAIQISSDGRAMRFMISDGSEVMVLADAECCSTTWIEHISLPAGGFPAIVLKVEDIEMPDLGSPSKEAFMQYYGLSVKTNRGDMVIDYRNESNGYYGGRLLWPGEFFSSTANDFEWRTVTQDK